MDFTFKSINLGFTENDLNQALDDIKKQPESSWHYNEFRDCLMMPLVNFTGSLGPSETKKGNLLLTEAAKSSIKLQEIIDALDFMDPIGKVIILKTKKWHSIKEHCDASLQNVGILQPKFRIALSGDIDSLYFIDKSGNHVHIPNNYNSYVIDGMHPHGVKPGSTDKITLCVGEPWKGRITNKYEKLLNESDFSMKVSFPEIEKRWLDPNWL